MICNFFVYLTYKHTGFGVAISLKIFNNLKQVENEVDKRH